MFQKSKTGIRRTVVACLYLGGSAIAFDAASAQAVSPPEQTAEQGFGDIVVTARKRAESLVSVPVSVTAIDGMTVQRAAASDLTSIAKLAPQLIISRADSGSDAAFSIRGIGSPPFDAGLDQSVSVSVDGVQSARGTLLFQGFFDLAQVEVMKGPQALFFGKNSTAGVIALTSNNPTDRFEAYLRGGYEFVANERVLEGVVSGPITDRLKARLALRGSKMDGWMKNYAEPAANPFAPDFPLPGGPKDQNVRDIVGRLTLVYDPTEALHMNLKALHGSYKDSGPKSVSEAFCFAPATAPSDFGLPDPNTNCTIDFHNAHGNVNPGFGVDWPNLRGGKSYTDSSSTLVSLAADYDFGDVTLSSVTGYNRYSVKQNDSIDVTSFRQIPFTNGEKGRGLTQELRLESDFKGPLNFTIGSYFEDVKRDHYSRGLVFFGGPDPVTGRFDTFDMQGKIWSKTYSAFAQGRWEIVPRVELAGGVRYTHETKRVREGNVFLHAITGNLSYFPLLPQGQIIAARFADSNWSPEVTLSWKPIDGTMLFAAYKTGYKSGGFSVPGNLTSTASADSLRIESERAKGGEFGIKSQLLDRALLLQLTGYLYDFNNLQVTSFDPTTISFIIKNAASVRIKGLEASADLRPVRDLTLRLSAAYNHAEFRSFPAGPCYPGQATSGTGGCINGVNDLTGTAPPRAPRWNLTAGADYSVAVGGGMMIGLNGDVSYSSRYRTQDNGHPLAVQKGYALLGGGIRLFPEGDHWELALIGRNLTNEKYISLSTDKVFGGVNEFQGIVQRARQVLLQGTIRM